MPLPCVNPPLVFRLRIRHCSITWSLGIPAQNLSLFCTTNNPLENWWWISGWVISNSCICCRYMLPDFDMPKYALITKVAFSCYMVIYGNMGECGIGTDRWALAILTPSVRMSPPALSKDVLCRGRFLQLVHSRRRLLMLDTQASFITILYWRS